MAKFNGSNSITSARTLYSERLLYDVEAMPENNGDGPLGVQDLNFVEMSYYGRVNTSMDSVVPNVNFIKQLRYPYITEYQFSAMDFVADAFFDLSNLFLNKCAMSLINSDDQDLSKIEARTGFIDPIREYRRYIDDIMSIYVNEYIPEKNMGPKILNIESYVKNLLIFSNELTDQYPLTLTAWHRSNRSDPFSSGIFLDVGGYNKDVDSIKEMRFINNNNFSFYVNACVQHGFMVSHKNPSMIAADLGSPAMRNYMLKYNLNNPTKVFGTRYRLTHTLDIDELVRAIYNSYNDFADARGFERERTYCKKTNRALVRLNRRNNINLDIFNNIINNKYIISFYTNLRNIEESKVFGEPDIRKIIRQANFLEKKVDISRAIGYINEQFRSTYKSKPGGVNWLKGWLTRREQYRQLED